MLTLVLIAQQPRAMDESTHSSIAKFYSIANCIRIQKSNAIIGASQKTGFTFFMQQPCMKNANPSLLNEASGGHRQLVLTHSASPRPDPMASCFFGTDAMRLSKTLLMMKCYTRPNCATTPRNGREYAFHLSQSFTQSLIASESKKTTPSSGANPHRSRLLRNKPTQ